MGKKKDSCQEAARRAWRLLRITLLWARKGTSLKCRLMAELRHIKHLKGGRHYYKKSKDMIKYGERELSFDETPVLHLKMSRPASLRFMIPCITPEVTDFDYDFGDDGYDDVRYAVYGARRSFLENNVDGDDDYDDNEEGCEEEMVYEDAGIDDKADEFIAKFYEQMKLQREISFQRRHNAIQAA